MFKWWKKLSVTEKGMLIFIIILVAGIIIRWEYISGEVSKSWKNRFATPDTEQLPADTITSRH